MNIAIFDYKVVKPFEFLGLTGSFWSVHSNIIIATWIAMAILFSLILLGRVYINREFNPINTAFEKAITFFINLCKDSFKSFNYYYFAFISSLFFFSFACCVVGQLPFIDEATRDLNTTFALGLTSFIYVQYQKIKVHGFLGFCKEFVEPFFILAPIHLVGELAKIASMSFRLFGNILGGGIISEMILDFVRQNKIPFFVYALSVGLIAYIINKTTIQQKYPLVSKLLNALTFVIFLLPWIQITLGIAEGFIQSFVLTMLTATYLSIGTQDDDTAHASPPVSPITEPTGTI